MIGISKLYCGTNEASDNLRYGQKNVSALEKRPIVVFNCTKRCNLKCQHCYAASGACADKDELTTNESLALIDDLAEFNCPAVLFSGGEPLLREDIFDLISHAKKAGLRCVLSTNGSLISEKLVEKLASAGLDYAGISIDGMQQTNDEFRCKDGAFESALMGIRNCHKAKIKVGLRLTMSQSNFREIPAVFDLIDQEDIRRICFYHLVYAGRGNNLRNEAMSQQQTRDTLDLIIDRTAMLNSNDKKVEVLTVDNHADGPYVFLRLLRENPTQAQRCLELLKMNGGNSSGITIGCVSWDGSVLPDQFWRDKVLGNVRQKRFSEIWSDQSNTLLRQLRDRKKHLKCRCSHCRWLDACNGNLRARAEAATGESWGDDPACYLTDEEIAQ